MATDGRTLYQLQLLDSEIDVKRRRLTAVEAALGESEPVRQARVAVEESEASAHRQAAQQRDLELELMGLQEKISRADDLLYGGTVKNAKELTDMQAEAASLRRRQEKLEDDLLAAMLECEEANAAVEAARARLAETQAQWASEQSDLQAEREALRARLGELLRTRNELLPAIEPNDMELYRSIRQRKGGTAVALIRDDTCDACGVVVTQNRKWHVREGELMPCSNCGRLLVLPPS